MTFRGDYNLDSAIKCSPRFTSLRLVTAVCRLLMVVGGIRRQSVDPSRIAVSQKSMSSLPLEKYFPHSESSLRYNPQLFIQGYDGILKLEDNAFTIIKE